MAKSDHHRGVVTTAAARGLLEPHAASLAAPTSATSASPVESFLTRFAAAKLAAESALSEGDAAASLAAAAAAIDDLDRLVAESSHALPPYELRFALATAADLRAAHRAAASEIRPRKSFSFRNKSRTPKIPPQNPATAPLPQPPQEQPKPSIDAILPGFGFQGRNGATLVLRGQRWKGVVFIFNTMPQHVQEWLRFYGLLDVRCLLGFKLRSPVQARETKPSYVFLLLILCSWADMATKPNSELHRPTKQNLQN
jgi:hypothetical protein